MSTPDGIAVLHGHPAHIRKFQDMVRTRQEFSAGNVTGMSYAANGSGKLNFEWTMALYASVPIDYVVYSYGTPIAWHNESEGWTVPNVKYSQSTTQHQKAVRRALDIESTTYREEI